MRRTLTLVALALVVAAFFAASLIFRESGLSGAVRSAAGAASDLFTRILWSIDAPAEEKPESVGGVERFRRLEFISAEDKGKGPRASLSITIRGSTGLKLAFLARGLAGVTRAPVNMFDVEAGDNTTPMAPAWVNETWQPILYRVDRFRYNSSRDQVVRPSARYASLLFHGQPTPSRDGELQVRNLVIYRGEDADPPSRPNHLSATPTPRGVEISWQPAGDNVGVALYSISRKSADGVFTKIGETTELDYLDRPPSSTKYVYRVLAADFQDNLSPWSDAASAEVSRYSPITQPTIYERDRSRYAAHVREVHAAGGGKVVKGLVLLFGDSLTGALNYRLETEGALGRYMVEARGRAGWKTHQGRRVINEDLSTINPEFCLILYGTNNSKSSSAIASAMNDMLAMVKACERNGAVPLVSTIPPRGFDDPASAPEARYNAALIETMRAHKIPIAYLFREFQAEPDRRRLLFHDGIHWDGEGFAVAARAWRKAMAQVRFVLLDRPG